MKLLARFMFAALCAFVCSVSFSFEAGATNLSPILPEQCSDNNGDPHACRVEVYSAGTTTPYTVYTDQARSAGATTVITANSAGRFADYYCDPADTIKFIVTDSADTSVYFTQDDVDCPLGASETSDVLAALGLDGSAASASLGTSGDVLCKINANCTVSGAWTFTTAPVFSSTSAGATAAPSLELYRNSASPAVDDVLGAFSFTGEDSGGNKIEYGALKITILDETDTTEDGESCLWATVAGTPTEIACVDSGGLDIKSGDLEIAGSALADKASTTGETVTADTTLTWAHGLGEDPDMCIARLRNVTADLGYSTGDEIHMMANFDNTGDKGITPWADATNYNIEQGAQIELFSQTSQNIEAITVGSWLWDLECYVFN